MRDTTSAAGVVIDNQSSVNRDRLIDHSCILHPAAAAVSTGSPGCLTQCLSSRQFAAYVEYLTVTLVSRNRDQLLCQKAAHIEKNPI